MNSKIYVILILVSSLFGYLEWGKENHSFLFQAQWEVLSKIFTDFKATIHPFVTIPLIGQGLLLFSLFIKNPPNYLIYAGIVFLGLLLVFMLFIGILSGNLKILLSTLPFIAFSVLEILALRKN